MEALIAKLSPIERKVLPFLASKKTVGQLAQDANVQEVEAMRACEFLANKNVLELTSSVHDEFTLTNAGEHAIKEGLPEQRFLDVLTSPLTMHEVETQAKLSKEELNASIGILKKAGAIQLGKEITKLQNISFEEKAKELAGISTAKNVSEEFIKRGLVEKKTRTTYAIVLTKIGTQLSKEKITANYEERLTSTMLKTGSWKGKKFRHYDVTSPVPSTEYGRKHFVQAAIEGIKEIWTEMGFTEMAGNMTQTAFWDLDALFVPQDHPAREMQDTFYLKQTGSLPENWKDIKAVHEDGGKTGSAGWQYEYSEDEAKKVLLRTHTTVLSAQTLAKMKEQGLTQGKFFSVNKVFRNEALDWKHLFEFHQVEGIVVGEDLTLADLIGLQKEFYAKMGFTDIRFRPAYFPYTEPSCEVEVFHPVKKQWLELGGMGVFRPEVVVPLLGKDIPVLAWGLGMERIISDFFNLNDLRQLYDNDLKRLRAIAEFKREGV